MHLFLFIFGIVLLPVAYTLSCYGCSSSPTGSCRDAVIDCPLRYQCGTLRVVAYAGGQVYSDVSEKGCALAEECISGSINFGLAKSVLTSKCCNTNLCNNQYAPAPPQTFPNGKKCYTCIGQSCTATLNCEGDEDQCISATVTSGGQKTISKGCASTQVCSNLRSAKIKAAAGQDIRCCKGDFCNSASSTSASLLLLVAPLIKFIIFS